MEKTSYTSANDLQKIASGGITIFAGSFCALALQFAISIIIVRSVTKTEFGLISLANTFTTILVIVAALGFGTGLPKLIAQYREDGQHSMVNSIMVSALYIATIVSLFICFFFSQTSSYVAYLFNKPNLETILKTFMLMVPPLSIMAVLTAIFRSIENAYPKVLFQDISLNITRLLIFFTIFIVGLGFYHVIWGYVLSAWVVFIVYAIYAYHKLSSHKPRLFKIGTTREIVTFSLPLLGMVIINNLVGWMGTLSLGYLSTSGEVGLYSAPHRLAAILNVPLTAFAFLYLPIATKLSAQSLHKDLGKLYKATGKWAFLISLPVMLYFIIDADFIIICLFGNEYSDSAKILRVLSAGYLLHTMLGPNTMTLVSLGKTYFILTGTVLACITALTFYLILIPRYGALGAAYSLMAAKVTSNVFVSTILYKQSGIHPFNWQYFKIILFFVSLGSFLYILTNTNQWDSQPFHLMLFPIIICVTIVFIPFLRTLNRDDIDFLKGGELRIRGNTKLSEWLARRIS